MFKILIVSLSLITIQAQAKPRNFSQRNLAKAACFENQIAFKLDGKSHCLDIQSPITDSEYQVNTSNGRINRYISNTDTTLDAY